MPYADVDAIAKQIPSGPGALHITLEDALKLSKQLKDSYDGDPQVRKLIDTARAIEGMPRKHLTHAAGVVITNRPVVDYVPLATNDGLAGHSIHYDHAGGTGPAENGLPGPCGT